MMSRKDYVAIAKIVESSVQGAKQLNAAGVEAGPEGTAEIIAFGLAHYFEFDNPNFDRARFMKACGW